MVISIQYANHDTQNLTGEFYDLMTSNSFLPLITRPTRVTATSATLIDNIFSNYLENCSHSMQGLMITDISDHYPIFHVNRQVKAKDTEIYMEKRVYSDKNKRDFTQALAGIDFSEISSVHGTQSAFDLFHGKLLTLLNKYFPKVRTIKKYNNRNPWLSEGLRKTIKHKNKLYYNYRKFKSVHNEVVYKAYKYKLQKPFQAAAKQYYHGLIVQYKNDMKKSCRIIKNIINQNKTPILQSTFKLNNGCIISDKKAVSEHFNVLT